ncbi:MAG: hypothetical protein A2096_15945 [Spirochaetes bacterium GWF1_41_5]|nr:MAG: hypothetical protein A2096_15945 [Spirochaetes bacterium GWF1_41_5]
MYISPDSINNAVFKLPYYIAQTKLPKIHYHNIFEIVYVFEGHFFLHIDKKKHYIGENYLYIVQPGTAHYEVFTNMHYNICFISVYAAKNFIGNREVMIYKNPDIYIKECIMNMRLEEIYKEKYYKEIKKELLKELKILIKRNIVDNIIPLAIPAAKENLINEPDNNWKIGIINKWKSLVEDQFHNCDLKISKLPIFKKISYRHFENLFKEEEQCTPKQYLTDLRIEKAKTLLKKKKLLVKNTAINCGFSSSRYFSIKFKNIIGISPADYRKLK